MGDDDPRGDPLDPALRDMVTVSHQRLTEGKSYGPGRAYLRGCPPPASPAHGRDMVTISTRRRPGGWKKYCISTAFVLHQIFIHAPLTIVKNLSRR